MKKGFTLIELIGVIIILSLLIIIGYPLVMKGIESSNENLSEANEQFIFSEAHDYIDKYVDNQDANGNNYPRTIGNVYCISTNTLNNQGYLSDSFVEQQLDNEEYYVEITVVANKKNEYNLKNSENCTEIRN